MLGVWGKAIVQDYLDLSFRPTSQVTARIVERPGLWMERGEIDALLADMRMVAAKTVTQDELDYGVLTGDADRLAASIVTILHDRATGAPIAFNALAVMDMELLGRPASVVHMGLVMVDPDVRSRGFSWVLYGLTCLVLFARNQMRPIWFSNVTQVPAIVGMVSETFDNVFPQPDPQARRSFEHLLLARAIMARHRHVFGVGAEARFDERRFVIEDAYTGGSDGLKKTFEQAPRHRDEAVNAFCARELDYARGDDVLQLCQMTLDVARRFVLRDVPRRSIPALAGALGFLTLNRLALPLLHWLTPGRPWGMLRPRLETKD